MAVELNIGFFNDHKSSLAYPGQPNPELHFLGNNIFGKVAEVMTEKGFGLSDILPKTTFELPVDKNSRRRKAEYKEEDIAVIIQTRETLSEYRKKGNLKPNTVLLVSFLDHLLSKVTEGRRVTSCAKSIHQQYYKKIESPAFSK